MDGHQKTNTYVSGILDGRQSQSKIIGLTLDHKINRPITYAKLNKG
jgi:hypothetical protein